MEQNSPLTSKSTSHIVPDLNMIDLFQQNDFPQFFIKIKKKIGEYFNENKENLNKNKINFKDPESVARNLFYFKHIAIELSNYIRTFEDFENLQYLMMKHNKIDATKPVNFEKFMLSEKEEFNRDIKPYLNEIFGSSNDLILVNNDLLELGKAIQEHFIKNLKEIGFTDKTAGIQKYFEENPKIFSFFLSLGIPDKEKIEIQQQFLSIYNNPFIALSIVEDELFRYLAIIYSLNEIIKMMSYIAPKLMMKE